MSLPVISREEAKALSLKRFFTGIPCKHGHVSERQVSSKACMACNKNCVKAYYDTGLKPKAKPEYLRDWYAKNPGKQKQYDDKRDIVSGRLRRRISRALHRGSQCVLSRMHSLEIKEIYELCCIATSLSAIKHEVDHIIPIKGKNVCGLHVPWNLQIVTKFQNRSKGNRVKEIQHV